MMLSWPSYYVLLTHNIFVFNGIEIYYNTFSQPPIAIYFKHNNELNILNN